MIPPMKKPPVVPYRFIVPASDEGQKMYGLLRDLLDAHHQDVAEASFALAWHQGWLPDADGRITLGECKKTNELAREVAGEMGSYDFVILLRHEFWMDEQVTDPQRRALLDHELSHAAVQFDGEGIPVRNERGRICYRIRKHDLEEFAAIAERYGTWKKDLEAFAGALDKARTRPRGWISYSRVREALRVAGVNVPLAAVLQWSLSERREAEIWATVDLEACSNNTPRPAKPVHVLIAEQHGASGELAG